MGRSEVYRNCVMVTKLNNVVENFKKGMLVCEKWNYFNVSVLFKYLYCCNVNFPLVILQFFLQSTVFWEEPQGQTDRPGDLDRSGSRSMQNKLLLTIQSAILGRGTSLLKNDVLSKITNNKFQIRDQSLNHIDRQQQMSAKNHFWRQIPC